MGKKKKRNKPIETERNSSSAHKLRTPRRESSVSQFRALTAASSPNYQLFFLLILFLVSVSVYLNAMNNDFIFDDVPLVKNNHEIQSFAAIKKMFFSGEQIFSYRALRGLSHVIDYKISGERTWAYHLSNMIYHGLASILVFLILLKFLKEPESALVGGLIFALHPVHVDAVAYISGRRDVLSSLFYFWGFLCFIKYREDDKIPLLLAAIGLYLCAMLTKEMTVTFPLLCWLYDFYRETLTPEGKNRPFVAAGRAFWNHKLLYLPLVLLGIFFSFYYIVELHASQQKDWWGGSALFNFLTVFRIFIYYIYLILFPVVLIGDYSEYTFPITHSILEPGGWLALALLLVCFGVAWRSFRKHPIVGFAIFWFFFTLLPVAQIIPHHEIMAEHYLYLPSLGFALFCGYWWNRVNRIPMQKKAAMTGLILLLVFYSGRTLLRNRDYRDAFTFWNNTVALAPNCSRAHCNLGIELAEQKKYPDAEKHFYRALAIKANYPKVHNNLGTLYMALGRTEEAIRHYRIALDQNPDYSLARNHLANALFETEQNDKAEPVYRELIEREPDNLQAFINLGIISYKKGNYQESLKLWDQALEIYPDNAAIYLNRGNAYFKMGDYQKALQSYQQAIIIQPQYTRAYLALAGLYQRQGDYERAIYTIQRSLKQNPDQMDTIWALGALYEQKGDLTASIEYYERLHRLFPGAFFAYPELARLYGKVGNAAKAAEYEKTIKELAASYPEDYRRFQEKMKNRNRTLLYEP